jgi:hypothetical protein
MPITLEKNNLPAAPKFKCIIASLPPSAGPLARLGRVSFLICPHVPARARLVKILRWIPQAGLAPQNQAKTALTRQREGGFEQKKALRLFGHRAIVR